MKNEIYLKLIDKFEGTVLKQKNSAIHTSINFFRRTNVGIEIYYIIMKNYYQKNEINFELLRDFINSSSRMTIKNIIDEAIILGFVKKIQNQNDKRKYNLSPSNKMIDEFESYVNDIKIGRVYSEWFHIPQRYFNLESNLIKVTLNANMHDDITIDGKPIQAVIEIKNN